MLSELGIDVLGNLDGGRARECVNRAIAAAVADMEDRGEDGKPREVAIKLRLFKEKAGYTAVVVASFTAPQYITGGTGGKISLRPNLKGGNRKVFLFQDWNPDDPDQPTTLLDEEGEKQADGE